MSDNQEQTSSAAGLEDALDKKEGKKTRRKRAAKPTVEKVAEGGLAPPIKYEIFVPTQMNRTELKSAPYNDKVRYMNDFVKERLRDSIKRGLFRPPLWNKRTGNLVAGHQRLEQLDALAETDNYSLTVLVIDVDETEEERISVADNNSALQGQYQADGLSEIMLSWKAQGIEPAAAGFEAFDLQQLGVTPILFDVGIETGAAEKAVADLEAIGQMKDLRKQHKVNDRKRETEESSQITIVCKGSAEFETLMKRLGRKPEDDTYIPGWQLLKALGISLKKDDDEDD
jgi:hypothetical protein